MEKSIVPNGKEAGKQMKSSSLSTKKNDVKKVSSAGAKTGKKVVPQLKTAAKSVSSGPVKTSAGKDASSGKKPEKFNAENTNYRCSYYTRGIQNAWFLGGDPDQIEAESKLGRLKRSEHFLLLCRSHAADPTIASSLLVYDFNVLRPDSSVKLERNLKSKYGW